jgi:predicted glutamine amidotransferase
MCRLFGQYADLDSQSQEPLCSSQNALRIQSHKHAHGWGIGWYVEGVPQVQRGTIPAHADDAFVRAAQQARSNVVVAHVRNASVGEVRLENTHPFVYGRWLFAHNGTVARFKDHAEIRSAIEARIDPTLRALVHGETDSERCFYLFLSRLASRGSLPQEPTLEAVRQALAETISTVSGIADDPSDPSMKPSSLNLLVTNGRLLAACRRGRTLHRLRDAGNGCLLVVASEPIGAEDWPEVPEDGFVGIDSERRVLEGMLGGSAGTTQG